MIYSVERMSDLDTPERQIQIEIEDPNIDDPDLLNQWLDRYVQKPFMGYEDKQHPDGTPYSFNDQVEASKDQLRKMAVELPELGAKKEVIIENLKEWVVGLQEDDQNPS